MRAGAALCLLVALLLAAAQAGKLPSSQRQQRAARQLWAGLVDSKYRSHRAAAARSAATQRKSQAARAASVAKSIAREPQHPLPAVKPRKGAKYVDLSSATSASTKGISAVGALPRLADFTAKGANYPRMPTVSMPPPPLASAACPETYSVKSWPYNAAGNGFNDDSGSIAAAVGALDMLYFPPGAYRIASNLVISKPILMGAGAWFDVAPGATLTLTKRPRKWSTSEGMFTGAGRVAFAGEADEIHPDWFKNPGESDSDALQQAADACAGSCTLILNRVYYLDKAVYLNPRVGAFSTHACVLVGVDGGTREGLVLTPGNYTRLLMFGTLHRHSGFALKIMGGVTGAEIQLFGAMEGGDGIVFVPTDAAPEIRNVFVTHMTATHGIQNTVALRATSPKHTLRNCLVRANFVLGGGTLWPTQQSAGYAILGPAAPRLVATSVVFQALDTKQFMDDVNTRHVFLQNVADTAAVDVVFQVAVWGGGMDLQRPAKFGRLVDGRFRMLRAWIDTAGGIPDADHFLSVTGVGNQISTGFIGSACCETALSLTPNKAAFNGGRPSTDQVFYVNAPITSPWPPNEVRTYYLWSGYAGAVFSSMRSVIFRAGNAGIVVAGFENQNAVDPGRIVVKLVNVAPYNITWMPSHRFALQIGPVVN